MRNAGTQDERHKEIARMGSSVTSTKFSGYPSYPIAISICLAPPTSCFQPVDESLLVRGFSISRPKAPLDTDRRPDDSLGQGFTSKDILIRACVPAFLILFGKVPYSLLLSSFVFKERDRACHVRETVLSDQPRQVIRRPVRHVGRLEVEPCSAELDAPLLAHREVARESDHGISQGHLAAATGDD